MTKTLGILSLAMTLLPLHAQHSGVDSPMHVTLDSLRDHYRPVLVFAPSTTPQLIEQLQLFAQAPPDLRERDVITIPLLLHDDNKPWDGSLSRKNMGQISPDDQAAARRHFHIRPNDFTVILLGKDGGEKLRSHSPISLETLRSTIDAMPMRQDEMRSQRPPK